MPATLTPKELAIKLDTDPKTARKFLRSITPREDQPGKGHRWTIEAKSVNTLKKAFHTWDEERKALIAARKAAEATAAAEIAAANEDEVLEDADDDATDTED
jgi:hypothetical protein